MWKFLTRTTPNQSPRAQETFAPGEDILRGEDIYAIFANRFNITATVHYVRIAFGELSSEGRDFYSAAVALPISEAKELAELILRLIHEIEEE